MIRTIALIILGIWISLLTGFLEPRDIAQVFRGFDRGQKAISSLLPHQAPLAVADEDDEDDD